jgi:bacterioferritin
MPVFRSDQRILGYLGRALSLELSAVQMYSAQAQLVATWGLDEPARRLRREAHEEMQHVERIIARMLALGAAPGASQLRPVRLDNDLYSLLQSGFAFEKAAVQLYADAAGYAARVTSHDDRVFFQALFAEEQEHAQELLRWIQELERSPGEPLAQQSSRSRRM